MSPDEPADAGAGQAEAWRPLSLRRNCGWFAVGTAVAAASRWGIVVVLARLGDAGMVGQVMLAVAICAPVAAVADLGLTVAQVTDAKREYRFGQYLGLRLVTALLAVLTVLGIVLVAGYEARLGRIVLVVALAKAFESVSEIFRGLMQQRERMDRVGIGLMIQGPLSLALLAIGLVLTQSLWWGMAGYCLAFGLTLLVYEIPTGYCVLRGLAEGAGGQLRGAAGALAEMLPRWEPRRMLKLAWLSLPLAVVAAMVALIPNLPRLMVARVLGEHSLGVFASVNALAGVGAMVTIAVSQSSTPRLARYYADGDRATFLRLLGKLLAVVGCVAAGPVLLMAVAGGPILKLVYGAPFDQHAQLAVSLAVAAGVLQLNVPLGKAIQAMRRFKTNAFVRGASVLALAVLLPSLIRADGLRGAAVAVTVSACVSVLAYAGAIAFSSGAVGHAGPVRWLRLGR